jgi:hypothetical protein
MIAAADSHEPRYPLIDEAPVGRRLSSAGARVEEEDQEVVGKARMVAPPGGSQPGGRRARWRPTALG